MGERIAVTLRAGGWTAAGAPLLGRAARPREALADPAYPRGGDEPGVHRPPVPGAAARDGPPHPGPAGFLLPGEGAARSGAGVRSRTDPRPVRPLRLHGVGSRLEHNRIQPRGCDHLPLPDPARGAPQHWRPAPAVRRLPLAAAEVPGTV